MVNYKELYVDLAWILNGLGCNVCDHDFSGYCYQTKGKRGFIVINSNLSYKRKLMTLAHEAGHLFYMTKGKAFNWSKKPRTEDQANWFALQLLRLNNIEGFEYHEFYNKAKKKLKNRKKSWFEL